MTAAVCVLLFGLIQRSVTIIVNTSDGSATGEISVITYYKIFNIIYSGNYSIRLQSYSHHIRILSQLFYQSSVVHKYYCY